MYDIIFEHKLKNPFAKSMLICVHLCLQTYLHVMSKINQTLILFFHKISFMIV